MNKHYNNGRVIKPISLNLDREKHLIDWFNRNKGQASVLIKQWIEREIENDHSNHTDSNRD